tara:strand:+ start:216995 stop:217225 length:231 start_codon:yes stop_codon:yes gene_type:complete
MEHKYSTRQKAALNETDFSGLLPIPKAAKIIGVQYRQLLDAVETGNVPHYQLGKSRRLVSVPEVVSIMQTRGGSHE